MIVGIMISKNGLDTVTAAWNGKVFRARDRHGAVFELSRQLIFSHVLYQLSYLGAVPCPPAKRGRGLIAKIAASVQSWAR